MDDYNHAIESTIKTLSADIDALNDAQYVLLAIRKVCPEIHHAMIDECLSVIVAALNRPWIDLSVFLAGGEE